jgi:hypothetical protein
MVQQVAPAVLVATEATHQLALLVVTVALVAQALRLPVPLLALLVARVVTVVTLV